MYGVSIEKRQILVVSGDPRVLAEMKMRLMEHFDVSIAAATDAAVGTLEKYEISAVVIHIAESGAAAFSKYSPVSESAKNKDVPFIFLAENDNEYDEIIAFESGADDYALIRHGSAASALADRLKLRICASENKKTLQNGEAGPDKTGTAPEEVLCGKTILVADDVEINREIIAGMLSEIEGLTLDFAVNGKEVVEKFSEAPERYSLILLDVQMPEMDGIEATKIIRNLGLANAREIPIIALTASSGGEGVAQCLKAGMDGFIEKPPDYFKLLNTAAEYAL